MTAGADEAVARFHLGGALLQRGRYDDAEAAFAAAAELFAKRGSRAEQAKAMNGLGAALRAAGRVELAVQALEHAAAGFEATGPALDEGAARFNLGLALREDGRVGDAAGAFERAVALLDPATVPAQAAAAMRELGATRLALGELQEAEQALGAAVDLAERAADAPGRGAAANTLGIARLAQGRPEDAQDAFRTALASSPRSLRPEAFAMAQANLALACERSGAPERARLAARQALEVRDAPEAVVAQARAVAERLGPGEHDLRTALEDEPLERRELRVREELRRTADLAEDRCTADMREWVDVHLTTELDPADVAELWLAGLLELPPEAMERLIGATVDVMSELDAEPREAFRTAVARAMARFHVPQMLRLQDLFERAAQAIGDAGSWR